MKSIQSIVTLFLFQLTLIPNGFSQEPLKTGPKAGSRTYAQNFKDMVLAECLVKAFPKNPIYTRDIASSYHALIEWTYFDLEKAPIETTKLVEKFLALDYSNLFADTESPGIEWNFFKCLDLYHSNDLEEMTKKFVIHPNKTFREENTLLDEAKKQNP